MFLPFYLFPSFTHTIWDSPLTFPKKQLLLKPQKPLHSQNAMDLLALSILDLSFFIFQAPYFLVHCCLLTFEFSSPVLLTAASFSKQLLGVGSATEVGLELFSVFILDFLTGSEYLFPCCSVAFIRW